MALRQRPQVTAPIGIVKLEDPGDLFSKLYASDPYQLPALVQGVRMICTELASIPIQVFNGQRGDVRDPVLEDPVLRMLNTRWNVNEDAFLAVCRVVRTVIDHGRCVIYIRRNDRGRPIELYPLDPADIQQRTSNDSFLIEYEYMGQGGLQGILPRDAYCVVDYLPDADGAKAFSPLQRVKTAIQSAIAANKYAEKQFASGGVAPFAYSGKAQLPEQMERSQKLLNKTLREMGEDGRKVLSVAEDATITTLGSGPEAMQLLENRTFGVQEVGRILGMNPILLGDLSRGSFTTAESAASNFVRFTLRSWAIQIGQALSNSMWPAGRRWLRFDLDAAKRGETIERIRSNAAAIQTGQMTPDEARADLGMAPMEGVASELWGQGALSPLEQLGKEPEPVPAALGGPDPENPEDDTNDPQEPLGGDPGEQDAGEDDVEA